MILSGFLGFWVCFVGLVGLVLRALLCRVYKSAYFVLNLRRTAK